MRKRIRFVSWRTAILFLLAWFIGFSILSDSWPIVRSEGEYATISHPEYGFAVDYPTKWKARTYGENGFKGIDDTKLRIYYSLRDSFVIYVRYQTIPQPTLEDVLGWSDDLLERFRRTADSLQNFEEIKMWEDTIRGHSIIRRRYRSRDMMFEDVYIARSDSMVIITLQANKNDFDNYLEEFNAIVASFRPLE